VGTLWVRHAPASAAIVRRNVCADLSDAGASDDEASDAALIASELVGNAVRHAPALPSGHLAIEWDLDGASYTIAVTDGGGKKDIEVKHPAAWETSGRGLAIVAAIADNWGVTCGNGTTTVWARGTLSAPRQVASEPLYYAS
jgi:serine/threonine-protein kinase RsbW